VAVALNRQRDMRFGVLGKILIQLAYLFGDQVMPIIEIFIFLPLSDADISCGVAYCFLRV
jgi:hypothetical protein